MMMKYLRNGIKAFEEHEILEMMLFILLPRVNTNPIAHELIDRFGSLSNVFNVPLNELAKIKGLGEKSAKELKLLGDIIKYVQNQHGDKITFDDSTHIIEFCTNHFKNINRECLAFFMLDTKHSLIMVEYVEQDVFSSANELSFDMKNIARKALISNSGAIIMAHNHINGTGVPSNNDLSLTRKVASYLKPVGIKLIDHIIVNGSEGYSLRASSGASDIWC